MSVRDVKNKIQQVAMDGLIDQQDVKEIFESAGKSVNADEMEAIKNAITHADNFFGGESHRIDAGALNEANRLGQVLNINVSNNRTTVGDFMLHGDVVRVESLREATTIRDTSFAGTPVPQAVQDALKKAFDNGLEPFDVTINTRDEAGEIEGEYTHYPSISNATGNMAFAHTEITPASLKADMESTETFKVIVGYTNLKDETTGEDYKAEDGSTVKTPVYEDRVGGTGDVASHYDEAYHTELFARGSGNQKWANNFAILSDGSVHALPAARRDGESGVILTNPALARGKRVLFFGHLDIRGGVVYGVEMSGRLCRRAAEGDAKFIDALSILKGWGFELSPALQRTEATGAGIQFSNTSDGVPFRDVENGVITQQPK